MRQKVVGKLKVHEAVKDEVYKDMVRVFWKERGPIQHNGIVKLSVKNHRPRYLAIRGLDAKEKEYIFLDWMTRKDLGGLEIGDECEFTLEEVGLLGKLIWAWRSSDPAARVATWIAIWSAILGITGLVFGAYPIVHDWLGKPQVEHVNAGLGPG
jgi:hypothetical protein